MIVLTAPTGLIGSRVLAHLVQANAPVRVIARRPEKIADDIRARIELVARPARHSAAS